MYSIAWFPLAYLNIDSVKYTVLSEYFFGTFDDITYSLWNDFE